MAARPTPPNPRALYRAAAASLAAAGALALLGVGLGEARAAGAVRPAATPKPAPTTPADANSRHYLTTELDVRPGIKFRVQPAYPARAARENVSGKTILILFIDANGEVENVAVESAKPGGYGFEQSAQQAFRAARFSPGMKGGKRVRVQMRLEVSFDAPPPQRR